MADLQIRRLGYALGAEVRGLDLNQPLDAGTVAELRKAWLEHLVLCFRDADITKDAFVRFAQYFGEIDRKAAERHRDHEHPDLVLITNLPRNGKPWNGFKQGLFWHSDQSFTVHPNTATLINGKILPEAGGDTMFANQYMAYETLSPALRRIVDGLEGVHDARTTDREESAKMQENRSKLKETDDSPAVVISKHPRVVHPIVRVHPETGRKALYVANRISHFVGMTPEETKPLLNYLIEHGARYEFTYRHRWTVNDIIMWDNRCLNHIAPSDYDLATQARHMWRCSLAGPVTGRIYEDDAQPASEKTPVGAPN